MWSGLRLDAAGVRESEATVSHLAYVPDQERQREPEVESYHNGDNAGLFSGSRAPNVPYSHGNNDISAPTVALKRPEAGLGSAVAGEPQSVALTVLVEAATAQTDVLLPSPHL